MTSLATAQDNQNQIEPLGPPRPNFIIPVPANPTNNPEQPTITPDPSEPTNTPPVEQNPYQLVPKIRITCVDQNTNTQNMIVLGGNACAFIVFAPPGASDAIRTDVIVNASYWQPDGSLFSPHYSPRDRTIMMALPVQIGASQGHFEPYLYSPDAITRTLQTVNQLFQNTAARARMVKAALSIVGGATVNPALLVGTLGSLDDATNFLFDLFESKAVLYALNIRFRICNYSVCTPELSVSVPVQAVF